MFEFEPTDKKKDGTTEEEEEDEGRGKDYVSTRKENSFHRHVGGIGMSGIAEAHYRKSVSRT